MINNLELIASHVGAECGIPFVALNPVVAPQDTLQKYAGSFVDYGGNNKILTESATNSYPKIKTQNDCGLILLESGDYVLEPIVTEKLLSGIYLVKIYEGGSHRFDGLDIIVGEIKAFVDCGP